MRKTFFGAIALVIGLAFIACPEVDPDPEFGVVINGVIWATCNVDAPGKFAKNPGTSGMLYQWNRKVGWSTTDPISSSPSGKTRNKIGDTGSSWTSSNDPCPEGWRVPTKDEFVKLCDATKVKSEAAIQNDLNGVLLIDIATNSSIFLPLVGGRFGDDRSFGGRGFEAGYWSSTFSGLFDEVYALKVMTPALYAVVSGSTNPGVSVRCVKK